MKIDIEYMKERIVREVEQTKDYQEIFGLFVTCLRYQGITYQSFRSRQNRKRADQIDLPFLSEKHLN